MADPESRLPREEDVTATRAADSAAAEATAEGPLEDPATHAHNRQRHAASRRGRTIFRLSTISALIMLTLLMGNVTNGAFGLIAYERTVDPESLAVDGRPLEAQTAGELAAALKNNISGGLYRKLNREQAIDTRNAEDLRKLINDMVLKQKVVGSFGLYDSVFRRAEVEREVKAEHPKAVLRWHAWLTPGLLARSQSSDALAAGLRTAIFGSLWTILFTLLVAVPIGIGAAVYLEEYASESRLSQLIRLNINNLAGVPSIIYGMLGLAVFVRALEALTSGAAFGMSSGNGRTVLSAGLTLALLVLPLVIINAQEAIRAVPSSLRQASYGLGATRWQTVWHHVLPSAIPGILTGTILAMSRAMGETAPLVVVGAATFLTQDPATPFAKFTTLPIQIYQWTSRPQDEFRGLAAAAILVLLALLLSLNAVAIVLRNRAHEAH